MKAKVTELSNKLYWIQGDNTTIEQIEAFNNCTTTLAELKEMWEDEKIKAECVAEYPNNFGLQLVAMNALKNSPRKFTIEQVIDACGEVFMERLNEDKILYYLTKLPPQGLEVEIENNKIVKVYL